MQSLLSYKVIINSGEDPKCTGLEVARRDGLGSWNTLLENKLPRIKIVKKYRRADTGGGDPASKPDGIILSLGEARTGEGKWKVWQPF
jgi:hypothetical protein